VVPEHRKRRGARGVAARSRPRSRRCRCP
jgi:hypothetical protein